MFAFCLFGLGSAVTLGLESNPHWIEREKIIQAHNADPGHTWKMRHNERFLGQPIGASKVLLGAVLRSKDDHKDNPRVNMHPKFNVTVLADSFDSATHFTECADVINDIRDQSACGCCWAFGAAEAASGRQCIYSSGQIKIPLSAQDLCFCAEPDGCQGGQLYTAWGYIQSTGIVSGGQYNNTGPLTKTNGGPFCADFSLPHCHHHGPEHHDGDPYPDEGTPGCPSIAAGESPACPKTCNSGANSAHSDFGQDKYGFSGLIDMYDNEDDIKAAIQTSGPIETAFTVYSDFENYSSGIYKRTSDEQLGGHAVRIVGWGEESGTKYWKIANSWNPYWGEDGYFRIVRGVDECGIESQGMASSSNAVWKKMG